MRDLNIGLREKEMRIVRLRQEIEALSSVIPLLADNQSFDSNETSELPPPKVPCDRNRWKRAATIPLHVSLVESAGKLNPKTSCFLQSLRGRRGS